MIGPSLGQDADNQGDAAGVDVFGMSEVEEHLLGLRRRHRLLVGGAQPGGSGSVDVAGQFEHNSPGDGPNPDPKGGAHPSLLEPARTVSRTVWRSSSSSSSMASTIRRIRNSPQPLGVCSPASFSSRSGSTGALWERVTAPRSLMVTTTSPDCSNTATSTGSSAWSWLPCSMAFIVASATAVLSRSSWLGESPEPETASATTAPAWRSW